MASIRERCLDGRRCSVQLRRHKLSPVDCSWQEFLGRWPSSGHLTYLHSCGSQDTWFVPWEEEFEQPMSWPFFTGCSAKMMLWPSAPWRCARGRARAVGPGQYRDSLLLELELGGSSKQAFFMSRRSLKDEWKSVLPDGNTSLSLLVKQCSCPGLDTLWKTKVGTENPFVTLSQQMTDICHLQTFHKNTKS